MNNDKYLSLLSDFLNNRAKSITANQVNKVTKQGVDELHAVSLLLEEDLGWNLDDLERSDLRKYIALSLKKLDDKEYKDDPYYKDIVFDFKKSGRWTLKTDKYDAYELFVWNDFQYLDDGVVVPSIGFFSRPFYYRAIYENSRLWMSVTPNEIETMKKPCSEAKGRVITFGLGMGYFVYCALLNPRVSQITVVEKDTECINLFKKHILTSFAHKEKVKIVNMDAFEYLDHQMNDDFDYAFFDMWHDVSDGLPMYQKIKQYESKFKSVKFSYWIFDTIKYYL